MRRLALAQLGSAGALDEPEFAQRVAVLTTRTVLPVLLRSAGLGAKAAACEKANTIRDASAATRAAASACERAGTSAATSAADAVRATRAATRAAIRAVNAATRAATHAATRATTHAAASAAASAATSAAAYACDYAAYYAADYAAADVVLSAFAEGVVQILIEMSAPGCQWLTLAPPAPPRRGDRPVRIGARASPFGRQPDGSCRFGCTRWTFCDDRCYWD